MADAQTMKCPACAGPMVFDPGASQIHCEYCGSVFDQDELIRQYQEEQQASQAGTAAAETPQEPLYGYSCGSCGANVWTDDTTLATYCFYCHNPVVLAPRIAQGFAPDGVVPFAVDREEVVKAFQKWSKGKKFTPLDFGTQEHLEKLHGVYLPFWQADGAANYRITGEGIDTSESRSGEYITTTRRIYDLHREGLFESNDITALANDKAAEQLVIGAKPFSAGEVKTFHPAFLQGFFAEMKNIEREQAEAEFRTKIHAGAPRALEDSISIDFDSTNPLIEFTPLELSNWRLLMYPFWLLTYRRKDITYLFCMNGVTGQTFGGLPVSNKRLLLATAILGAALTAILLILGYFI